MGRTVFERLRWWWVKRRLVDAVLAKLVEGSGVSGAQWPAGTSSETVLRWLDEQLGGARTPYGVSGAKVVLFRETAPEAPWLEQFLPERRLWWLGKREEVAQALEGLLEREGVTTAVAAVGTALDAVWKDAGR